MYSLVLRDKFSRNSLIRYNNFCLHEIKKKEEKNHR